MKAGDDFRGAELAKAFGEALRALPQPALPLDDAELAERLAEDAT